MEGDRNGGLADASQEEEQLHRPLSKNQEKKLKKQQRYEEQKRLRKEQEKQARQAQQEQRRAEGKERLETMTEEEKVAWRQEKRAKVEARRVASEGKKAKLRQALQDGQRVVIDLDFEDKMSEAQIKSLCQQLGYAYGENTRAQTPCHLVLTSVKGRMAEHIAKQLSGFDNWVVTRTEDDYLQHFAGQTEQLVYLTADSPDELQELDPSKIYIIGGIVDRNRCKGLCFQKAESQGIATGKLPIGEHMKLASSQVMTTNHMVEIILRWLELRNWEAALDVVIPTRKRKHEEQGEGGEQREPQRQQQEASAGGVHQPPAGSAAQPVAGAAPGDAVQPVATLPAETGADAAAAAAVQRDSGAQPEEPEAAGCQLRESTAADPDAASEACRKVGPGEAGAAAMAAVAAAQ